MKEGVQGGGIPRLGEDKPSPLWTECLGRLLRSMVGAMACPRPVATTLLHSTREVIRQQSPLWSPVPLIQMKLNKAVASHRDLHITYPPRAHLIVGVLTFVRAAQHLPGITLIGSLTTNKAGPKDADLLVTVTNDINKPWPFL